MLPGLGLLYNQAKAPEKVYQSKAWLLLGAGTPRFQIPYVKDVQREA